MIESLNKIDKKYSYNGIIIIPRKVNISNKYVVFKIEENQDLSYLVNIEIEKEIDEITKEYLWKKDSLNKIIGMWKDYPQSFILQENGFYNSEFLIENVKYISCAIDTFIDDFNTMFPTPYSLNEKEFRYLTHQDRKLKNNLVGYYEVENHFYYSLEYYFKVLKKLESEYKKDIEYAKDIENFKSYEDDLLSDGISLKYDEIEKYVK